MNDNSQRVNETVDEPLDSAASQLTATAYHEAGHAVMALALGRTIQKVSIRQGRSQFGVVRMGVCEIQKGRSRASKNLMEDEVLILFAGMVAEARFTGQYCEQGAMQDLAAIKRALENRSTNERQFEKLHRRLLDKTEHLLDDEHHTKTIEIIARELIEKTTISGRAVRHYFEQALKQIS